MTTAPQELFELVLALFRRIVRREQGLKGYGALTLPQVVILDTLLRRQRQRMHDLALLLGVQMSAATGLVDRMVKAGLVARSRDEADRRVVWVSITPRGRLLFTQFRQTRQKTMGAMLKNLSGREQAAYLTLLRKILLSVLLFGLTLPALAQEVSPSAPLTLEDCYRLAAKRSEAVAIQKELITETEARFTQAMSGILPRVTFSSSDKRQDGSGGSAFTLKEVPERKFVMSQPLFSGFKEFAAMAGSKAEGRQRRQELRRAQQLLFIDVAEAFVALLRETEERAALASIRTTLLERLAQVKERERLGWLKASEAARVEAELHRLDAGIQQALLRESLAQQLLEFLTGVEPIPPILETETYPFQIDPPETYLAKAFSRPDVLAAQESSQVALERTRLAKAGRWPTVNLEGNYFAERVGASKEVDWDAALKVEVPLFEGGQTRGAVAQAASGERQAQLALTETQRKALSEIKDAYTQAQSALGEAEALAQAWKAVSASHTANAQEFQYRLVSPIRFLESLQELQEAQRQLIQAQYEAKRYYLRFKAITGEIPV